MSTKELCHNCGASMMVNKYTMNLTLLRALYKMAKNPGKKARDIGLTKVEYSVYTKLKFWDLITRRDDGLWVLLVGGQEFLKNSTAVPKEISYFRNKIVGRSLEMVYARDILPTEESKQKYREMMEAL
jgi:hypothetical protein